MEENTEISKSNKIKIIVITALIFLVSIAGISYAYFTIQVVGNETASSMRLRTANMQLIYNDVQIVSGEYAQPGWTQTKTLTVQNVGNVETKYNIIWRDLYNEITNGELVISATCSSSSGSCNAIPETIVPTYTTLAHNIDVTYGISIAPGVTHTYTLTALFKETGSNQNYNQNKEFYGTLNIDEYGFKWNGTEPLTGVRMVKLGSEEFYAISDELNYTSLINTNGNIYNYDSSKTVLFAKYNLYVGRIIDNNYVIQQSDPGYGLQSAEATADYSASITIGAAPFAGSSSTNGYWISGSNLKSQYGANYEKSNIYDANYVTAPNYSVAFNNNAGNANYSVAYYVEEYVNRLGINGVGRLLTYSEVMNGVATNILGGSSYWIGSAGPQLSDYVMAIQYTDSNLSLTQAPFDNKTHCGVRPVIVVNTSDIK